jgi:putative thioredoxin
LANYLIFNFLKPDIFANHFSLGLKQDIMNFQKQVIERSHHKPVLVDFWAPWCGPCKVLGPVLEKLAEEQSDRWELVKVNTEEHPGLAQQYDIMSIPNVKLFHKGKVVNEFAGALPKYQLEKWLDENIPDPSAAELENILNNAGETGDETKLRAYVEQHPDKKEAKLALAKHLVFKKPEEAETLVGDIPAFDPMHDDAEDVRTLSALLRFQPENGSAAGERLAAAKEALKNKDFEAAIQRIIDATMADKSYLGDLPRRSAIALFHFWGSNHELTKKYRRRFDMVLY